MFLSSVHECNINYIVFCFESGVNMWEKNKNKNKKAEKSVYETLLEVWDDGKCQGHTSQRQVPQNLFEFFQTCVSRT